MKRIIAGLALFFAMGCSDRTQTPQAKRVWVMSINNRSAIFQQTDGSLEAYRFCDYPPFWQGLHLDIVMTYHDDTWDCWAVKSAKPVK